MNEYWVENTLYYETLRGSIDLSGEFEAKDIGYIRDHFWKDDKRDGAASVLNRRVSSAALRSHEALRGALAPPFSTYQKRMPRPPAHALGANPSPPTDLGRRAVESGAHSSAASVLNRRVSSAALRSHEALRGALAPPFSTYQKRMP